MARLTMSFLGTIQITLAQQPISHFRSSNNQGLLVYLALRREQPHPREVLATLFWPEETEADARNNLRQALYQLRKLLGDLDGPTEPYLLATRQSIAFNGESDYALDVATFLEAVEAGDLERAVACSQGELLPGFTCDSAQFEDWLRQERQYLHRLALEAMFEVTRDHLQAGRLEAAQTVARKQLGLEPWRERAHRQLMRAYARAGDRGSALAQYHVCREALAEALGVEPATETVTLYEEIRDGRIGPQHADEVLRPPPRIRHNLPADTTPFIGREIELDQVQHMLTAENGRLVTIVGPGGMGKTRLALAAGSALLESYRDGVFWVDLAPLAGPEEIGESIAAALDYQAPDKTRALLPQLLQTLSRQQLLLVLDNYEHLLDGAGVANDILRECPHLRLLATSRQRLNLASESRYELGGLAVPERATPDDALGYTAVKLFVDSGRRTRADFALSSDNVADVIRICRLVQGMPLGLVLAAAWLEVLSPGEIAEEIESGLDFLAADLADLPPRQRSMQTVFKRSWEMMSTAEQKVLARLSVFRGGFTREAAEQVAGANLRVLLSLTNKSLLQREAEDGRFTMHELLRQYAAGQRRQSDPVGDVALAHCRYFAGQVRAEVRRILSFYPLHMPREFAADRDNLRRAWDYALKQGLAGELPYLARGMVIFNPSQGIDPTPIPSLAIQSLQQRGAQETDHAILHLRLIDTVTRQWRDDIRHVRNLLLAQVSRVEEYGDPELCFWTYHHMGNIYYELKNLETRNPDAVEWHGKSIQAARAMGDETFIKMGEAFRFWAGVLMGLHDATTGARLEELLAYFEPQHSRSFAYYGILHALIHYCSDRGEYEQAIAYGKRALVIAQGWRDLLWISIVLGGMAENYLQMGLAHEAGLQDLEALEWHLAIGEVWQTLGFLHSIPIHRSQLIADRELAVAILSMVYHHPEVVPKYRQHIEDVLPRYEAELGPEAYGSAWEQGKEMDFDTAVAQMQAALGGVEA